MIGFFDSGMGGLTVLKAFSEKSPQTDVLYFGDLKNMPFGEKSEKQLQEIVNEALRFFKNNEVEEIVMACNSVAFAFQNRASVIEMVQPTVSFLSREKRKKIMVVSTLATMKSGLYKNQFLEKGMEVISFAIPDLAFAIEQDASDIEIEKIIEPSIKTALINKIDVVVLGCTQFPFVMNLFRNSFLKYKKDIEIFDPANAVCEEIINRFSLKGTGKKYFFISKESQVFRKKVKELFGNKHECQLI